MKVSVIVPVYNAEKYIERCINSVLAQTFKEFELILVDDASIDTSLEICQLYEKKDCRVKVVSKENGGPHSARKQGINCASGLYTVFLDSDDWIEDTFIESMVNDMMKENADYLVAGYTLCEEDTEIQSENQILSGVYYKEILSQEIYQKMLCPNYSFEQRLIPALWGKMFKTQIIRNIMNELDEDICIGEDLACTFKYILQVDKVYIVNTNFLYHYMVQKTSVSNRYDAKYFDKSIRLANYLDETVEEAKKEYLQTNIDCYKAFLVYRLIGIMLSVSKIDIFITYMKDVRCSDNEIKKLLQACDVYKLNINKLSKYLLICLKQNKLWRFRGLMLSLFLWNRIKRR